MMRILLRLAVLALTLASLIGTAVPASAANCQFVLGFKALHDMIPSVVGNCIADETHNGNNGDGLQQTTGVNGAGGLLVWRKADNWTAFTDGYHTWINGPGGLQERLNTQRFTWEADYTSIYALKLSDLPSGYVVDEKDSGAVTNDEEVNLASNPIQEKTLLDQRGRIGGYEVVYEWNGSITTGPIFVLNGVSNYKTVQGAQMATADPAWSAPPSGWQSISAPTVGDQSVAFTLNKTLTIQGQSVPVTYYEIRFRVGSVLADVVTGGLTFSANVSQAVSLAQIVVNHIKSPS